jgi:hypothetical protein
LLRAYLAVGQPSSALKRKPAGDEPAGYYSFLGDTERVEVFVSENF